MDTPEIRKGDFVFRDTFFVDLGSNKRHARASLQDLEDLLLPKSRSTPKDQVAHWYEAQLIHYGLPRSKDKNTAKVRLTSAITSKALTVPKDIVAIEGEMKKEYASTWRKAKIAASKGETKVAESKSRKSTSKTTVELEIDGMKIKIDREDIEAARKKAARATEATPKTKGAKASESKQKAAATSKSSPVKAGAVKSSLVKPANNDHPPPRSRSEWPMQTARRGNHSSSSVTDRPTSSFSLAEPTSSNPTPRTKQTAKQGKDDPYHRDNRNRPTSSPSKVYDHTPSSFRNDVDLDDAPPSYESIDFNQREEPSRSNAIQISGTYFFPRPPFHPFDLTLQIDKHTQKLWGRFQIASKEGVLRMDDISHITSGDAVSFGWRSEDQDNGFMKFGRRCDGTMEFDGAGWVKGHFKGLMYGEDVHFEGNLVNDEGLNVEEMNHVWGEFPTKAYGRG